MLNAEQNYDTMSKEKLIQLCIDKDITINKCIQCLKCNNQTMLGKKEIMEIYHCENNKALKILKIMFQMGYGNKIGKEYYVSKESLSEFTKNMAGKEVCI